MKNVAVTYGPGGYIPAQGDKNITATVVTVRPGLGTDRETIPANGTTVATLNYAGPEASPHAWTVNGAPSSIVAVLDAPSGLMASEIEVTAAAVGPVEVTAGSASLTIMAV